MARFSRSNPPKQVRRHGKLYTRRSDGRYYADGSSNFIDLDTALALCDSGGTTDCSTADVDSGSCDGGDGGDGGGGD